MANIYVAGPMRGKPDSNFAAFDRAAGMLLHLGWTVFSPAEFDRVHGDDPKVGEQVGHNGGDPVWVRKFVQRDVTAILTALKAENGDAIAILPGCRKSVGCTAELALALWLKLKVVSAVSGITLPPELLMATSTVDWEQEIIDRPASGCGCSSGGCHL